MFQTLNKSVISVRTKVQKLVIDTCISIMKHDSTTMSKSVAVKLWILTKRE